MSHRCPVCASIRTRVITTRTLDNDQGFLRRRACSAQDCDHRWYTLQPVENPLDPERIHWKNPYAYVGRCDVEVRNA